MNYFYNFLINALDEKNMSINDLVANNIVPLKTIYHFKQYYPTIKNAINIANYLEFSLDYILERTTENNFRKYKYPQTNIFEKINNILLQQNIKQTKLYKDLNISRTNFSLWKNKFNPRLSMLISIADYLGCDIDDLLVHTDE